MQRRSRPSSSAPSQGPIWAPASLLFLLALGLRLLFWTATPDRAWPWSAAYKGDAPTWLAWAASIRRGVPFEVGLPVRPPGAAYLVAALGFGDPPGLAWLGLLWCAMGAATVALVYVAVARSFGPGRGVAVGVLCAGSTGLMILSTSLNNETPYLLLVTAALALWQRVRKPRGWSALAAWSALHALACLTRAEHLLYFLVLLAILAAGWTTWRLRVLGVLVVFTLVLAPWHLTAWSQIRRFNEEPLPVSPETEALLARTESLLSGIAWSPEALAALDELSAATRRTSKLFVAATVGVRGGSRVGPGDLAVLEEAFGSVPEPLARHPWVALYGGLNFHLANNPWSTGGFTRAPLEQPPPLVGGAERYPLALVAGLPPAELTFTYPPHLEAVNYGYRLGFDWIRRHPADFARLALAKLRIFWEGAALGLGGYDLPLGLSGVRRAVDLVVPSRSAGTAVWRGLLLVLVAIGAWRGRRHRELVPWIAFLAAQLVICVAFFGYARHGATVIPVVAVLGCLAVGRGMRTAGRLALVVGVVLLMIEGGRWLSGPEVRIDGREVGVEDPWPARDHRAREIRFSR